MTSIFSRLFGRSVRAVNPYEDAPGSHEKAYIKCAECNGTGKHKRCGGSGEVNGERCSPCKGSGDCPPPCEKGYIKRDAYR
jgi:hypothetical protein